MASGYLDATEVKVRLEKKLRELESDDDPATTTEQSVVSDQRPSCRESENIHDIASAPSQEHIAVQRKVNNSEFDWDSFEWDYVDNVEEMQGIACGVCLSVLEDPQLLSCCGDQLICKHCLQRSHDRNKKLKQSPQCPFCRSENFKIIPEANVRIAISRLKVRCPQTGDGCKWVGIKQEAKQHLEVCPFFLVSCPNSCTSEKFKRQHLENHITTCPERPVQCPLSSIGCKVLLPHSKIGTHMQDAIHDHLLNIAKENVRISQECLNASQSSNASSQQVLLPKVRKVEALQKHLSHLEVTAAHLETKLRDNKKQMESVLERNVQMGAQCVEKLREKSANAFQLRKLSHSLQTHLEPLSVPVVEGFIPIPVTLTLDKFNERKANNEDWLSPPFYTHLGGYKMCLAVHPNGYTENTKGRFVSIYLHMMKGEHDEKLIWPFQGAVITVLIVNQRNKLTNMALETHGHARKIFYVTGQAWADVCQRVTHESYGPSRGSHEFISHSNVGRYLSNDTLKVKVHHIDFLPL